MSHLPENRTPSALVGFYKHFNTRKVTKYGQVVLSISVVVTGTVFGVRTLGWLQPLELGAFDQMVQQQPERKQDDRILIVGIDEEDIAYLDQWPVSDEVMADLLVKLQSHNPKVIGLDLHRNISHPPGEAKLRSQLAVDNVVVIEQLGGSDAISAPDNVPLERVGFNNFSPDANKVLRRNLMAVQFPDQIHYSLALQLSRVYLKDSGLQISLEKTGIQLGDTFFQDLSATSGSYQNLDERGYQILARYHTDPDVARQVTLNQVLNGDVNPDWIENKIVLIGTVAPSIKDLFYTPYSSNETEHPQMSGVMIHAHFTSQILRAVLDKEPLFWFFSDWGDFFWMLGWAAIGGSIAWSLRHPGFIGISVLGTAGVLVSISYGIFLQAGWIPLWPALLTLGITSVSVFSYKTLYKLLYDTLTGLPQKTLFLRAVEQSLKRSAQQNLDQHVAVIFIDLDGFKRINESLGHDKGDRILLALTQRFKQLLPAQSQLSRFVGDKFAVKVSDLDDDDHAVTLACLLQNTIQEPITIDGQEIVTSASIGIALEPQDDRISASDLLRDAQTATHQAKSRGKNHIEVFTSNMRLSIIAHFQTEADLRCAIERQELRTYYQPFISLQTGNIAGFEALVRWQHPEHGLVPPGKFIPVAEDTDLIIPIGQWVLQEACQQMRRWHKKFSMETPPIISVNLSGRQFAQPHLVKQIEQTLKDTGLPGQYLKLELTESILMDDVSSVIETLNQMKRLNLHISIDDFGTGYSSLSYLHRFPIDTLKVDRSFVMNIDELGEDHAIVETIITLGHHLGMDVIAEGIETAEQAQKLKALNCEYGQGYFFGRPLPAEEAEAFLSREMSWLHSA